MTEGMDAKRRARDHRYNTSEKGLGRSRLYRANKLQQGLCQNCGKRPLGTEWYSSRVHCEFCNDRRNARFEYRYETDFFFRIERGLKQRRSRAAVTRARLEDALEVVNQELDALYAGFDPELRAVIDKTFKKIDAEDPRIIERPMKFKFKLREAT